MDDYRGEAAPASLHRYVYVHNAPVNAVDPSGYAASDPDLIPIIGVIVDVISDFLSAIAGVTYFYNPSSPAGALIFIFASILKIYIWAFSQEDAWDGKSEPLCPIFDLAISLAVSLTIFIVASVISAAFFSVGLPGFLTLLVLGSAFSYIGRRVESGLKAILIPDCGCK